MARKRRSFGHLRVLFSCFGCASFHRDHKGINDFSPLPKIVIQSDSGASSDSDTAGDDGINPDLLARRRSTPGTSVSSEDLTSGPRLLETAHTLFKSFSATNASNLVDPAYRANQGSCPALDRAASQQAIRVGPPLSATQRAFTSEDSLAEATLFPESRVPAPASDADPQSESLQVTFKPDGQVIKLPVGNAVTARFATQLLLLKRATQLDHTWTLMEHWGDLHMERVVEDHERVLSVRERWGASADANDFSCCHLRDKYDVVAQPENYFPTALLAVDQQDTSGGATWQKRDILQSLLFSESGSRSPDLQGKLFVKQAGKKSCKKHFCVLRLSGLYYSTKGESKEPQHLRQLCSLADVDVYLATAAKKTFHVPDTRAIVLRPSSAVDAKRMVAFCPENPRMLEAWLGALRIVKYGKQLQDNYQQARRTSSSVPSSATSSPSRENGPQHSVLGHELVAMDFTGSEGGRVVDDPNEAMSVAITDAQTSPRSLPSVSLNRPPPPSPPLRASPMLRRRRDENIGVPRGQGPLGTRPWYHGCVSRHTAVSRIVKQGLQDGTYLVRESSKLSHYAISLAYQGRVYHIDISPVQLPGEPLFYTIDKKGIKFPSLQSLIEFYQINATGLPCNLRIMVPRT